MKQVYEKKEEKNKRANAALLAALFFSLALIGGGAAIIISGFVVGNVAVTTLSVVTRAGVVLSVSSIHVLDTGINIANTTSQMTTLMLTLISVFIPLMIIMWYFGIFSDLFGMIGNMMRGAFKRN